MADLSAEDRARVYRALMRYWSRESEAVDIVKSDLLAAVVATDDWIDDNQGGYNSALPEAARTGLSAAQKTLLFCAVGLMRVDPGIAALLKRALGVEVN